jgi:hypothetical protein
MGSVIARQCSRNRCLAPVDSLDSPSWPRRRSRSSELEGRIWSRAESEFLCPSPSTPKATGPVDPGARWPYVPSFPMSWEMRSVCAAATDAMSIHCQEFRLPEQASAESTLP